MNSIVVHYKELALKGRNRPWFVQRLVENLRVVLEDLDVAAVRSVMGRIEIEFASTSMIPSSPFMSRCCPPMRSISLAKRLVPAVYQQALAAEWHVCFRAGSIRRLPHTA